MAGDDPKKGKGKGKGKGKVNDKSAYIRDGDAEQDTSEIYRDLRQKAILEDLADPDSHLHGPPEIRDENHYKFLDALNEAFHVRNHPWFTTVLNYRSGYRAATDQIRRLDRAVRNLVMERKTLKTTKARLEVDIETIDEENMHLEAAKNEGHDRERTLNELIAKQNQSMSNQKDRTDIAKMDLQAWETAYNNDLETLAHQHDHEQEELQGELTTCKVNVDELQGDIIECTSHYGHELSVLSDENQRYAKAYLDATLDLEQAEKDAHSQAGTLALLQGELTTCKVNVDELQGDIIECTSHYGHEFSVLSDENQRYAKAYLDATLDLEQAEKDAHSQAHTLALVSSERNTARDELAKSRRECSDLRGEIEQLRSRLTESEEQSRLFTSKAQRLEADQREEIRKLQANLMESDKRCEEITKERDRKGLEFTVEANGHRATLVQAAKQSAKLQSNIDKGRLSAKAATKKYLAAYSMALSQNKKSRAAAHKTTQLKTELLSLEEKAHTASELASRELSTSRDEYERLKIEVGGREQARKKTDEQKQILVDWCIETIAVALVMDHDQRVAHRKQLAIIQSLTQSIGGIYEDFCSGLETAMKQCQSRATSNPEDIPQISSIDLPLSVEKAIAATGDIKDAVGTFVKHFINASRAQDAQLNAANQQIERLEDVNADMRDEHEFLEIDIENLETNMAMLAGRSDADTEKIGSLEDMLNQSLAENKKQVKQMQALKIEVASQSKLITLLTKELNVEATFVEGIIKKNQWIAGKLVNAKEELCRMATKLVTMTQMSHDSRIIVAVLEDRRASVGPLQQFAGPLERKRKTRSSEHDELDPKRPRHG